jgi:hypothetical protein
MVSCVAGKTMLHPSGTDVPVTGHRTRDMPNAMSAGTQSGRTR